MNNLSSNGKAITIKKTFSRETGVSVDIHADRSIIWLLLTNASDFPRWNSTVLSVEGEIKPGNKIKLKSALDPRREFKLTVKEFVPEKLLAWGDGLGKRIYSLSDKGKGWTTFTMTERIGGPVFPLFAKMIPPFDQSFEKFANDLKKEAETISNTR